MRKIIFPYRIGSGSAKLLSREIGAVRVFPDRKYRPRTDDLIINWGNSQYPRWWIYVSGRILNGPKNVAAAVNKLSALSHLRVAGVKTVPFTHDIEIAKTWPEIVERHKLTSSCGDGIQISTPETVSVAPLYTQYIRPDREYRVHVFNGKVIDYVLKRKREGVPENKVKNHENGYVFSRRYDNRIDYVEQAAIDAVAALGLDFGAVDIIRKDGMAYVLEVNTAPGIEGTTLQAYANAINEYATE